MKYRYDIQEVRAVAIVLVIFYHINMKLIPGGYIGVDVFFVISGFLVTSVLCSYKKFTYEAAINFYGKRIKRLFPSSYVCLCFYYFYHPTLIKHSQQETELFYDIISALFCISNFRFYKTTLSYFQNEKCSILKNYWSLSLEEQFYIIFPLLFFNFSLKHFIILSLISYIYCIVTTYNNDTSSYYLLESRVWELVLGIIAYKSHISIHINNQILLFLIIAASYCIGIYTSLKFPGFIAAIPTCLTSFILIQDKFYLFKSRALYFIGNVSYVLYLFHYPIIQNNKSVLFIFIKLYFSAYFIFYYIELPSKRLRHNSHIFCALFLLSSFLTILIKESIKNNINFHLIKMNKSTNCKTKIVLTPLLNKSINSFSVVLIGDSHLAQYISIIFSLLENYKIKNILFISVWINNIERNYEQISNLILDIKGILLCIISLYVEYTFLHINKDSFEKSFIYFIKRIVTVSNGIIILQDNPHRIRKNDTYCKKYLLPKIENSKIYYVDIFNVYCKGSEKCISNIYTSKIFRDFQHLNEIFLCRSKFIYSLFIKVIDRFLSKAKSNITICSVLDLKFKHKTNIDILRYYNIKTINNAKFSPFGFIEPPNFCL